MFIMMRYLFLHTPSVLYYYFPFILLGLVTFFSISLPNNIKNPILTSNSRHNLLQACDRFLALKTKCLHPTTQSLYIISLKGGKDNSPEGLQVRQKRPLLANYQGELWIDDQLSWSLFPHVENRWLKPTPFGGEATNPLPPPPPRKRFENKKQDKKVLTISR